MNDNDREEVVYQPIAEQPKSIAELYVYTLQMADNLSGSERLDKLYTAINYANALLGGVGNPDYDPNYEPPTHCPKCKKELKEDGVCLTDECGFVAKDNDPMKYPLDNDGVPKHPILQKIASEIYEDKIMPSYTSDYGDAQSGRITINVGGGFDVRGTMETAQLVSAQAEDWAYKQACRKVHKRIATITHILGQEGLLPPHTMLSDIGMERTLQGVITADTYLFDEALDIADVMADEKVAEILEKMGIEAEEDSMEALSPEEGQYYHSDECLKNEHQTCHNQDCECKCHVIDEELPEETFEDGE